MRKWIQDYINTCDTCSKIKVPRHKPYGLLQSLEVPSKPWASISMDFIVDLPASEGHDSVLVVVDRFSKVAHFLPCSKDIDAAGTAKLFLDQVFKLHGFPETIISDRGSVFTSKFWSRLLELCGVKRKLSTSYHPQIDGQIERVNQILEQYLRAYCDYQQDNWCPLLSMAEFAYNNAIQASSKQTPFFANYGYHPHFAVQPIVDAQVPAAENRATLLREVHNELKKNVEAAQKEQAKYYDRRHMEPPDFKVGNKVWLLRRHIKTTRPSDKLDYQRLGPFVILQKIGSRAYKLQLPKTMNIHDVFHVSLLEPYHANIIPGRIQSPPAPAIIEGQEEYEVEQILDSRIQRGKLQYLVDWKGYGPADRSWEPIENLEHCNELIDKFHSKYQSRPRRSSA